jgi:hypothetical protein
VAIGLDKLPKIHRRIVFTGAIVLILVNGFFMNANILAKQNPLASNYESDLKSLPSGSYVISNSGGNYGLDDYYMMASGVDIRPIFIDSDIANIEMFSSDRQASYEAYLENFLETKYNVSVKNAILQVQGMVKGEALATKSPRYIDYKKWMNQQYGLEGDNTIAQVEWLLSQNQNVFVALPTLTPYWQVVFQVQTYNGTLSRVIGVNNGY